VVFKPNWVGIPFSWYVSTTSSKVEIPANLIEESVLPMV